MDEQIEIQTQNFNSPLREEGTGEVKPPSHHIKPWLALGIVAVLAAAVGFWAWTKSQKDNNAPQPPLNLRGGEGELASWQTYRNEEYGFEVKYPSGVRTEITKQASFSNTENVKISFRSRGYSLLFTVEINPETLGIENCETAKKEYKIINGINAVREECGGIIIYDFSRDTNSFLALLNSDNFSVRNFDQILSTFKFISPASQINSFESCAQAGYAIMESYPERCRTSEGLTFVKNYGACITVVQSARNPATGEVREFPTPCDVPEGWIAE